ncbi:hypothetical protein RJ639_036698 [Escallonia herrerae]|uniref:Protein kinase domain-containing protein n=1 Tax=Escallonia herrerae TaxID=1293975 RepID=A0AA89B7F9_9ASTE|nr:hypothetical protein RJ639_036698 [Escallonia herrerae]
MDPETYRLQRLTTKSDVYSFGVLLLELLSGSKVVCEDGNGVPRHVIDFVVPYIVQGNLYKVLDPEVSPPTPFEIEAVEYMGYLAADCTCLEVEERPTMTEMVSCLERALAACLEAPTSSRSSSSGVDAGEAACNIGDLKELNHLQGCLRIEGLGNVVDACEAEKAELKNKKHLSALHLSFNPLAKADGMTEVVKALQLHPNLQFLQLKSYGGTEFPAWIISLTNLKKLRLQESQGCTSLPPLGKLPSLETLYIEHMQALKRVTGEFLGIDIGNNDGGITRTKGRAGVSSSAISAFPKLKKLTVSNMRNWEEWDVTVTGGAAGEAAIRIMPCLQYLKLSHCNKLKMLPQPHLQMTPLNKLRIHSCPLLQQRYQKERGED